MRYGKIIPVEDAVALIQDGDVVASSGYGGNGTPEALFVALERRFLETGTPRNLTLVWAGARVLFPTPQSRRCHRPAS